MCECIKNIHQKDMGKYSGKKSKQINNDKNDHHRICVKCNENVIVSRDKKDPYQSRQQLIFAALKAISWSTNGNKDYTMHLHSMENSVIH